MTVGGKVNPGGTSMLTAGVVAVSVSITLGLFGSSLVIVNVHDLGPTEVGVNAIVSGRLESGLRVAGNGLPSIVKSGQLIDAPVTFKLHGPVLATVIVFCALLPLQTLPNIPEPLTVMF